MFIHIFLIVSGRTFSGN